MSLLIAKKIKHLITVEYTCPVEKVSYTIDIENPNLCEMQSFLDIFFTIEIPCRCGKNHVFELEG